MSADSWCIREGEEPSPATVTSEGAAALCHFSWLSSPASHEKNKSWWKEGGYEREGRGRRENESVHSRKRTHTEQTEACIGWHCLTCSHYCCRLAAAHGELASARRWPGAWWGKETGKRLGPHRLLKQGKLSPRHHGLCCLSLLLPGRGNAIPEGWKGLQ